MFTFQNVLYNIFFYNIYVDFFGCKIYLFIKSKEVMQKGSKHSEESKAKMRAAKLGKKLSAERKKQISIEWKQYFAEHEEAKKKLSNRLKEIHRVYKEQTENKW